jgi:hypothetical protein
LKAGIGGGRGRGGEYRKTRTQKNCSISARSIHGLPTLSTAQETRRSSVAALACNDST